MYEYIWIYIYTFDCKWNHRYACIVLSRYFWGICIYVYIFCINVYIDIYIYIYIHRNIQWQLTPSVCLHCSVSVLSRLVLTHIYIYIHIQFNCNWIHLYTYMCRYCWDLFSLCHTYIYIYIHIHIKFNCNCSHLYTYMGRYCWDLFSPCHTCMYIYTYTYEIQLQLKPSVHLHVPTLLRRISPHLIHNLSLSHTVSL